MAGGTVTISGGNVIHTFNSSGYLTPLTLVGNSLRFRSSASAYLNRTPTTVSNRKTWTWSGWVKLGEIAASNGTIFAAGTASGVSSRFYLRYTGSQFQTGYGSFNLDTTVALFRDPAAWYHVVIAIDTTQATTANRLKIYVNGIQQSVTTDANYSQNDDTAVNNTVSHQIASDQIIPGGYFDGYMTEVQLIDGQALTPNSFGTFNSFGVWQPITYGGSYGTNGFYLPFTNATSTTTLGFDFSPQGNNWTTNNISLTAGSTYDSMTDVPTLTSTTAANYATLNPLMFRLSNVPGATLSNGNLTSTHTPSAYGSYVFSTIAGIGNKFYYEVTITNLVGGGDVGINDGQAQYSLFTGGVTYLNTGNKVVNGSSTAYGSSWTIGDVIGVAFDLINGTITFYKNNTSQGVASSSIGTSAYFAFGQGDTGSVYNWNFGQRPFVYTPPSGFLPLNTFNL
jgi:hypothetical protein